MKYQMKIFTLLLVLAAVFLMASVLPEPWNTVLFIVVIPLLQQAIKLYSEKTGKTIGKLGNQAISLVLALVFLFLAKGFAGIEIPSLPMWGDDIPGMVNAILAYVSEWVTLIGALWGSLMALYEVVYDRAFVAIGWATEDKYE